MFLHGGKLAEPLAEFNAFRKVFLVFFWQGKQGRLTLISGKNELKAKMPDPAWTVSLIWSIT